MKIKILKIWLKTIPLSFAIKICISSLFFILVGCQSEKEPSKLEKIQQRGYVTVGTLFGNTSYYLDAEGPAGFEYELAKQYADHLDVKLKIIPSYNLKSLFQKLDNQEVDLIAAGLSITDERAEKYLFSPSYDDVSHKLVYKQGKSRPREIDDLTGNLLIVKDSSHAENLKVLKQNFPTLSWQETEDLDNEELLLKVLADEVDYTIIDDNALAINRRYYPEISVGFTIRDSEPLAWMLHKNDDHSLWASVIEFFGQVHHNGVLLALDDKYYGHIEDFNYVDTREFIKAAKQTLPKYQAFFEKHATDMDWRLLAAISYQESHWKPHARSYTGVRGMMMLTLPTAKQMGIKSRLDPEQSIQGGAKYFKQLFSRMPDRIPNPDRLWFALASYNIGLGHVNDARKITRQQGGDPDRWVEVKERLPLLKQKKYYKKTRYGYARGDEPVNYVENIRRYYHTLIWIDEQNKKIQ